MASGIQFDPAAIRALADILRETDLSEIEIVEKDSRVRVVRHVAPPQQVMVHAAPAPVAAVAPAAASAAAAEAEADHPGTVTSPMVGVAYLAPEPGAAPFIQIGAKVAQGQTLLLIEAMKTFNQIRAPRAGTITRILIETGTPVEFGEALLVLE
ncbi:acetyl-CoA carboxylase biotin carboxyl carrier protein [Plastoroseomonas arctica]|uniref:Biotin carboxyl carrier protein of acetyl-CoA carboxylase n=1 Tax=Plastoroseomonas arctica TaxID=1509237 RepID=A0AAF1JUT3_9PROT|nr:acetyl-CoA carboxylase biotin carboxyl carrier protein [Plastoroseomonas arctica]MBR0653901.1 acetyl-CoA carboxylase biotin carboxyl carrier protein [Plastoroseomonas arctica]